MPLVARLGDPATHPGTICTSATRTYAENILIARVGDTFCCVEHGPNPIVSGCLRSYVENKLVAVHGSLTSCGASIIATAHRTCFEGTTCP